MLALDNPPPADLADAAVLTVAGRSDPYGDFAPALEAALRERGARLDSRRVEAGHELIAEDAAIVQQWTNSEAALSKL